MKNKNLKRIAGITFCFLAILALVCFAPQIIETIKTIEKDSGITNTFESLQSENFQIHFLDVGDADCAYLHCEDTDILIDAADTEPKGFVTEYLKRKNIQKLDLAVISHPHKDHIGQMSDVLEEFPTKEFMMPKIDKEIIPKTQAYDSLMKTLQSKNIKTTIPNAGEEFNIGKLKIKVLGPVKQDKNLNNNSLVLKITYKKISAIFAGDAEKEEENSILKKDFNLDSTILKVGHHGSNTSSTFNFLKAVNPKFAVVSKSSKKDFKKIVENRFKNFGIEVFRTENSGNIIFSSDGEKVKIDEEKSK